MKILVCGAAGLLGSSLAPFLRVQGHEVMTHSRGESAEHRADLSETAVAHVLLTKLAPDVIVNLVGLTDVDRCEAEPNEAYRINVRTVENIAAWMRHSKLPCHLVHISTDQVYDGSAVHTESQISLTNYYAFSKYAGELAALAVPSTILRTNFFGRSECPKRTSLTDWLYRALVEKAPIEVFEDVLFSPLSIPTLSMMIELSVLKKPMGVFNLGSHDGLSKADFAFAFAEALGASTATMTRASSTRAAQLKAYRPKDMRMDVAKFEHAVGVALPLLEAEIKKAAEAYT